MKKFQISLMVALLLFQSSCATLFSSSKQNVSIRPSSSDFSNGRAVVINGSERYDVNLPTVIRVSRGRDILQVRVKETKCFKSTVAYNDSSLNYISLLNLLGGLFGLTSTSTDAATGAMWSYEDNMVVRVSKKDECRKQY